MALIITTSPTMARIVGDYLREQDGKLTVVWMTTVKAACNRLESEHADTVVIDAAIPESEEAIYTLHLADPKAEVQVLAGGN
jgi:DNA-binding response OmpR family regulator